MDTIDSVQHDIRAWRRRQPRGALPAALRGRILALGSELDRPGAHRALGVHPSTLYRWREQARSTREFVELRPEPHTAHEPKLRLEISRPDGTHLRFVGLDLDDVANLLVRLQAARLGARRQVLQIVPHMRILVARGPLDFRRGIDGTIAACRQVLLEDPFSGAVFVFRARSGKMVRILVYDGQGFWLMTKRLSAGRFRFWCEDSQADATVVLEPPALVSLLAGADWTQVRGAPPWRPLPPSTPAPPRSK